MKNIIKSVGWSSTRRGLNRASKIILVPENLLNNFLKSRTWNVEVNELEIKAVVFTIALSAVNKLAHRIKDSMDNCYKE